ncbi:putative dithiol-disulfide oxidoreductase (DUF899 family) [Sphingopyxis panaciterrae]|uniref:DUF899 family protein n=1 Tax=Sphingopyxis panaciterrae TaxID=363841 RepID=UPI0014248E6E|nr:DUF899 family protein [Sphingopyxis panaciterrae]NIJ39078.1 putative dithiol-disulfide oxidoreductase (DUF899 family) [Sphingopyxis panaciterrae]
MTGTRKLIPAEELVRRRQPQSTPNESAEYRAAREALLVEEIELRRHLARVAAQRRALPPGGAVTQDYRFVGADGEVGFAELFGDHDTLFVYGMMYGPERKQACPMCTATVASWDPEVPHLEQRIGFAIVARSPYPRLAAFAREQGWNHLKLYADPSGDFWQDYIGETRDDDMAGYSVFTRKGGTIRHFWSVEGGPDIADPGQDPHGAPDPNPLWNLLDLTPEGRGTDWYPSLSYDDA